jgi:hypothetical protein
MLLTSTLQGAPIENIQGLKRLLETCAGKLLETSAANLCWKPAGNLCWKPAAVCLLGTC